MGPSAAENLAGMNHCRESLVSRFWWIGDDDNAGGQASCFRVGETSAVESGTGVGRVTDVEGSSMRPFERLQQRSHRCRRGVCHDEGERVAGR